VRFAAAYHPSTATHSGVAIVLGLLVVVFGAHRSGFLSPQHFQRAGAIDHPDDAGAADDAIIMTAGSRSLDGRPCSR